MTTYFEVSYCIRTKNNVLRGYDSKPFDTLNEARDYFISKLGDERLQFARIYERYDSYIGNTLYRNFTKVHDAYHKPYGNFQSLR